MSTSDNQPNQMTETVISLEKVSVFDNFRRIFIYFWITSLIGHYVEVIWAIFRHQFLGASGYWLPTNVTIIPLAAPYGLGVVAIILFVMPLMKKYKLNPALVFVLNVVITALVEYICAAVLVLIFGRNEFWNYSNVPFNLNGYICLSNTLTFGLVSTIYIYFLHPILTDFLKKLTKKHFNTFFWITAVSYMIDLIYVGLK